MVVFHSYVSLPEGNVFNVVDMVRCRYLPIQAVNYEIDLHLLMGARNRCSGNPT